MILTFGEMLVRLEIPTPMRFAQSFPGPLHATFAGAESNMAIGIAALGGKSRFATTLPSNDISQAALRQLHAWGVDTQFIQLLPKGRFGSYYLEHGAGLRAGQILYDRTGSTFAIALEEDYDWNGMFQGVTHFLISAISPAVSETAAKVSLRAVQEAKKRGVHIILDLNYRSKLWQWKPGVEPRTLARETMIPFLALADDLLTNLGQLIDVMNLALPDSNDPTIEAAQRGAEKVVQKYPQTKRILITLRESFSANHNQWSAFGYDATDSQECISPRKGSDLFPYDIQSIVDRIGVGDAFGAAYLRSIQLPYSFQESLDYATAAGALAHYVHGDLLLYSHEEVLSLMKGNRDGRIRR